MATVDLQVPDSVLAISGKTAVEFAEEARFLLAAKLFELGRLSSGQAAQLCGKNRVDFLMDSTASESPRFRPSPTSSAPS